MSLSKRNGVYYIDIRTPSGERIRRSTGVSDKKLAQEYHDKVKHELWAVSLLDKRLERTFDEALLLLLNDGKGQKDYATKVRHAKYWRAFNRATEICNIEDFHFHDLRHTWASWHVQSGTPLFTLKELGGWETLEMVKKYAHLNAEHLSYFSNAVTIWSQNQNKDNQALNLAVVNN
jgi:integrase